MTRPNDVETCRAKNCRKMAGRRSMVAASKVRKQPTARGFYCQDCALRVSDPLKWVQARRMQGFPQAQAEFGVNNPR